MMVTITSVTVSAGTGATRGWAIVLEARGRYREGRGSVPTLAEGTKMTMTFPPKDLGMATLVALGLKMRIFWSR